MQQKSNHTGNSIPIDHTGQTGYKIIGNTCHAGHIDCIDNRKLLFVFIQQERNS